MKFTARQSPIRNETKIEESTRNLEESHDDLDDSLEAALKRHDEQRRLIMAQFEAKSPTKGMQEVIEETPQKPKESALGTFIFINVII